MNPNLLYKIPKESSVNAIYTIAKGIAVLYFLSRTVKTCFEIAEHIEKRNNLHKQ